MYMFNFWCEYILTLARTAQKKFLIEVIVGKKMNFFVKLSNIKRACLKQTSFNVQRIYGRRQYGSRFKVTRDISPTISGWLLVKDAHQLALSVARSV